MYIKSIRIHDIHLFVPLVKNPSNKQTINVPLNGVFQMIYQVHYLQQKYRDNAMECIKYIVNMIENSGICHSVLLCTKISFNGQRNRPVLQWHRRPSDRHAQLYWLKQSFCV